MTSWSRSLVSVRCAPPPPSQSIASSAMLMSSAYRTFRWVRRCPSCSLPAFSPFSSRCWASSRASSKPLVFSVGRAPAVAAFALARSRRLYAK